MNFSEIQELVNILESSSLAEMAVKKGDFKIILSKFSSKTETGRKMTETTMDSLEDETRQTERQQKPEAEKEFIVSPIVGTFYAAPAPDAPEFVRTGDHVKGGQTVCILEAMKLMNEIQSDYDCEIVEVLAKNEQKVEYGQPLFCVKRL